jgi:hypothetical protein
MGQWGFTLGKGYVAMGVIRVAHSGIQGYGTTVARNAPVACYPLAKKTVPR